LTKFRKDGGGLGKKGGSPLEGLDTGTGTGCQGKSSMQKSLTRGNVFQYLWGEKIEWTYLKRDENGKRSET